MLFVEAELRKKVVNYDSPTKFTTLLLFIGIDKAGLLEIGADQFYYSFAKAVNILAGKQASQFRAFKV